MQIGKGFGDPVRDTQGVFRRILSAMSTPGSIAELGIPGEPPSGLPAGAAAVLMTLADVDTAVWLPEPDRNYWHRWLAFHTGAPLAASVDTAVFAVIDAAGDGLLPSDFNAGDDRYPDRSTTVIALCESLESGPAVEISGPGIDGSRIIFPNRPANRFWRAMAENHALYPRGVDVVLVAGQRILALPRSLSIKPMELSACT